MYIRVCLLIILGIKCYVLYTYTYIYIYTNIFKTACGPVG